MKPRFPNKLPLEFLYVDLLNNLEELAEDRDEVLRQARSIRHSRVPSGSLAAGTWRRGCAALWIF
jgi:hypothetical protein